MARINFRQCRNGLSLVLDDYNYASRRNGADLIVIVIGRCGEQALPAPLILPIRQRPSD